jgi:hypothetical protein
MIASIQEVLQLLANSTYRVIFTTISMVSFWIMLLWAFGYVPAFGQGVARQEDVSRIQQTLLESAIIEARIRYCSSPNGTPTKRFFLADVNTKLESYFKLTGRNYPLPSCEELVFANVE